MCERCEDPLPTEFYMTIYPDEYGDDGIDVRVDCSLDLDFDTPDYTIENVRIITENPGVITNNPEQYRPYTPDELSLDEIKESIENELLHFTRNCRNSIFRGQIDIKVNL